MVMLLKDGLVYYMLLCGHNERKPEPDYHLGTVSGQNAGVLQKFVDPKHLQ
jgi:hypothetical protein